MPPRLSDKLIGPVLRRLMVAAAEAGLRSPIAYRVLGAVVSLTLAYNRVQDSVSLRQLQHYAGLMPGQAGRANHDGAKVLKATLRELADADLIDLQEPPKDATGERASRGRRWWIGIPDRFLAVDNPVQGAVDNPANGVNITPFRIGEGGELARRTGSTSPHSTGSTSPRSTYRRSTEGASVARTRARPPTLDGQRQLNLDPPRPADADDVDAVTALIGRLDADGLLGTAIDLVHDADPDGPADPDDDVDLADAIYDLLDELEDLPDGLPALVGLARVRRLPGPVAARVIADAVPLARHALTVESAGVMRPLSDRPDDPLLASHLDQACQTILDQLSKGA